jgi:hypothetical protein
MKQPTKQLLDDLLADSASPEFCSALLARTLNSARRRKRAHRFKLALGAVALAGMLAFAFQARREPAASGKPIRPSTLTATPASALPPVPVVSTKLDSTVALVQTSEACRPREINDQELLAFLVDKSVALARSDGRAELIYFDQNN